MSEWVKVELIIPEENLTAFKRVAKEMFPFDDMKDAVQNLLWFFIERIGDSESWSFFLAGLPIEARDKWRDIAERIENQMKSIPREHTNNMPPNFFSLWQKVNEDGGKLTEEDAVAVLVAGAAYGQLQFDGQRMA